MLFLCDAEDSVSVTTEAGWDMLQAWMLVVQALAHLAAVAEVQAPKCGALGQVAQALAAAEDEGEEVG